MIILLIASFIAYLGYCALRDALQMRRDNAAFVTDSARVVGRIVSHETYTDTTAQRNSHYKPVVAYTVNGMSMQVTAQNSTNLRGSLTEFKVGTPIEVIYLRQRPQKAQQGELVGDVEVRGRLVEQENVGALGQGAGDDDALALAPAELVEAPPAQFDGLGAAQALLDNGTVVLRRLPP